MFKIYHFCCMSILLYIIPIIYHIKKIKEKSIYYNIILFLTIFCIICSNLFWINPIKNNIFHKIDGIVAKITFCSVVYYTLYINLPNKNNYLLMCYEYIVINIITLFLFLMSFYFSSKKWCSNYHICFHIMFHLFGLYSTFYTHF